MWLFTYNHTCFGYIQITTLNNKNTFGAPYFGTFSSLAYTDPNKNKQNKPEERADKLDFVQTFYF